MTRQKKLKKEVRSRARKTGESYTAARRHVLAGRHRKAGGLTPPATRPSAARPRPARPARGGQGEASVVAKTGHGYDHWFAVLDAFDAKTKGHTASAAHLYEAHGVPGWHSQMITVAYERERGLRAVNQTRDGDFQVSVTRTVPASVAEVADAIGNAARRRVWLRAADPALARALNAAFEGPKPRKVAIKKPPYAYVRFRWDRGRVALYINGKPNGGSSIAADNKGLDGADKVEPRRAQWKAALEALKRYLER